MKKFLFTLCIVLLVQLVAHSGYASEKKSSRNLCTAFLSDWKKRANPYVVALSLITGGAIATGIVQEIKSYSIVKKREEKDKILRSYLSEESTQLRLSQIPQLKDIIIVDSFEEEGLIFYFGPFEPYFTIHLSRNSNRERWNRSIDSFIDKAKIEIPFGVMP